MGIALGFMWGFGLALNQALFHRPILAPEFIQLATIFLGSIALFVDLSLAMIRVLRRPFLSAVSVDMTRYVAIIGLMWMLALLRRQRIRVGAGRDRARLQHK